MEQKTLTAAVSAKIKQQAQKAMVGQEVFFDKLLVALFAQGHVLIEGVPGLGKTLAARVLARTVDAAFKRIQFTPDMMPSDITGTNVFDMERQIFILKKGPLFTQILLADEINRTPPKTQAALLEAMEERSVTIDGENHVLQDPFMVLATQNPIEFEGTYPLPEAQLDRFLFKLIVSYPAAEDERLLIERWRDGFDSRQLEHMDIQPVASVQDIAQCRDEVRNVRVEAGLVEYILQIVRATRSNPNLSLGASPRACLGILTGARAIAAMEGRDYVIPDDIQAITADVLAHRVILEPQAQIDGVSAQAVISQSLHSIKIPG